MSKPNYTEMYFDQLSKNLIIDHTIAMNNHARALSAHCECLAMNAENMSSAMVRPDCTPPYSDVHYFEVMKKWGLINEKGEPLI
jgi:hypothetical protein